MGREIERKFFCDSALRPGTRLGSVRVEQGYVSDTGNTELRLRRTDTDRRLTLKNGGGADRYEWEIPISAGDFDALWPRTDGLRVTKIRERFEWKTVTVEVDRYEGPLSGLFVAEVEFASLDDARNFAVPRTFGPELTWDPRFKNKALAADPAVPRWPAKGSWSYGVLPYRTGSRGIELVAVTTRRNDRWIVPKGQPEPGKTPEQVAIIEAQEEAGITGKVTGHPLVLPYARETGTTNLLLFPMLVTRLADRWRESGERERRSIPLAEAADYGELIRLGAQALQEWGT